MTAILSSLVSTILGSPLLRGLAIAGLLALIVLALWARNRSLAARLADAVAAAESAGRTATTQREMLDAAARRPRTRSELAGRMLDGTF